MEKYRIISNLIDFVEKIERRWVTFLNGKNQRQSDQRLLASTELVHVFHFGILAAK